MKKILTIFGATLFASVILTSCGAGSIESDAKKVAEPQYKAQKLIQNANSGDMTVMEESTKLTTEAADLSKEMEGKYTSDSDKKNLDGEKITYHIPSPSGSGTGVCEVTISIDKFFLLASETCGGHDENGHTESTEKLFKIELKRDFKYKVSKLINRNLGSSFGCEFFEIKQNKLHLYDENYKIINDWFCTHGNIENREDNLETCDCIFLPSEN